jgi:hypothetical protein
MRNVEGYFRALTLTVAVIFLCACTAEAERPTPTKQFANELARQILAAKIHKVYVPNFSDRAGEHNNLGRFFAAKLSNILSDRIRTSPSSAALKRTSICSQIAGPTEISFRKSPGEIHF